MIDGLIEPKLFRGQVVIGVCGGNIVKQSTWRETIGRN